MSADRIIRATEALARPIAEELGLELVEVQFRRESGWVLRLFIDRDQGGVHVDDCAAVSRQVGAALEVEDLINHAYTLEVSSPGAERPLKRLEDFVRFAGRRVRIKLKEPVKSEYVFVGTLTAAEAEHRRIILDADHVGQMTFALAAVAKARLSL